MIGQVIGFFAAGVPQPKGSTRAFLPKGWKRPIITSDNAKTKPWENAIRAAALHAWGRLSGDAAPPRVTHSLTVRAEFRMPRPKGHTGVRGLLPSAPDRHRIRPDVDKLVRALLDALTGTLWMDDSQVDRVDAVKRYASDGEVPGVRVEVSLARGIPEVF